MLLGFQVRLQTVIPRLELVNLVLHLGHLRVPGSLLSLMRKQELSLFCFSSCRPLLDLALTVIEVFTFLVQFALQVNSFSLFLLLDDFKLISESLV